MRRKERYGRVVDYFRKKMPVTSPELHYGSTFQLLVAVVLSAQCTDKRVNIVTAELFRRFPTPSDMARADEGEIRQIVSSVSYPNAKSHYLVGIARALVDRFGGEVPSTKEALMSLPGVGLKTANVVLSTAFGKPVMAVDTHVFRASRRLGLVGKDVDSPEKAGTVLEQNIAESDIPNAHHWLLLHGRYVCTAKKPRCGECPFNDFCPYHNP